MRDSAERVLSNERAEGGSDCVTGRSGTLFSVLPKADGPLAVTRWVILVMRGVLPALSPLRWGVLPDCSEMGERSQPDGDL